MIPRPRFCRAALLAFTIPLPFLAQAPVARAQIGGVGLGLGGPGLIAVPELAEGQPINAVDVALHGEMPPGQDATTMTEQVRHAFGFGLGSTFNLISADAALGRVKALAGVRAASYRLLRQPAGDVLTVVLDVALGPAKPTPSGMLTGGGAGAFPVLYQDDRSLLRFTLNGGLGLFSDGNPWFGQPGTFTRNNPLVQNPAIGANTGLRASWLENYVE